MKKIAIYASLLAVTAWGSTGLAKTEYVYKQPNNPANFIKLADIGKDEAQTLQLNQPYQFTEDQMADILRSLRYNRKALFSDKIKTRRIFEEEYIEKYTPLLVKAFNESEKDQIVYWSVVQKRPFYVIRDDKLTQVAMWVTGQELHMRFDKTEAKLLGDYQARTQEGKKMRRNAIGLRISLEPQQGQKLSFNSSREIVLDINSNWEAIVTEIEAEEERIQKQLEYEKARGSKRKKLKAEMDKQETAPPPPPPVSEKDKAGAEDRLEELKRLKDKGLINQKDYDKKKDEILKTL